MFFSLSSKFLDVDVFDIEYIGCGLGGVGSRGGKFEGDALSIVEVEEMVEEDGWMWG